MYIAASSTVVQTEALISNINAFDIFFILFNRLNNHPHEESGCD